MQRVGCHANWQQAALAPNANRAKPYGQGDTIGWFGTGGSVKLNYTLPVSMLSSSSCWFAAVSSQGQADSC